MPDFSVDSFWIKRGIVELLRGGLQEALHGGHVCGCVSGSFFPWTYAPVDFGRGDRRRRRWRGRRRDAGEVIVEVEVEPQLAAVQSALQCAGGGEQVFFKARQLAVAEGALAMKEFFHGGIIPPLH